MISYWHSRKHKKPPVGGEDGVVALEFTILFPLFMIILVGLLEFGHLFYVRHTLTNASREGARAAVMYHAGTDRISWAQTQAVNTINNYLGLNSGQKKVLPGVTVTVPSPQVSGSATGSTVKVTLTAANASLVLGKMISAFQNLSVTAETTMKME